MRDCTSLTVRHEVTSRVTGSYGCSQRPRLARLSPVRAPSVADVLNYKGLSEKVFPTLDVMSGRAPTSTVLVVRFSTRLTDRVQRKAAVDALNAAVAPLPGVTVAGIAAVSEELEDAARDGVIGPNHAGEVV